MESSKLFFCIIILCGVLFQQGAESKGCKRPPAPGTILEHVETPRPQDYLTPEDLPQKFDWRWKDRTNFATPIRSQLMPKFCGSCWAFAVTSAISDRMKIQNNATLVDITLAPQVLLDCGDDYQLGTCEGGSASAAHQFIHENGITDETCAPYMAADYVYRGEQDCRDTMCRTCDRFGSCAAIPNPIKHSIAEYGDLEGEAAMMAEVYARGPIVCAIYAHSKSFEYYTGGIIVDRTEYNETTHDISIVGWGVEDGINYWIGRNSYGTYWGEVGWFRIERGVNCLLIESECHWSTPA